MKKRGYRAGRWGDVERGMTAVGVALAGCAATFAIVAVRSSDGVPMVNGVEHFALFAKPTRALDKRLASTAALANRDVKPARQGNAPVAVDYAPTASIRSGSRRPAVLESLEDRVLVEGDMGLIMLRPGASLQGIGRLEEIRFMRGRWVAIFGPEQDAVQSSR